MSGTEIIDVVDESDRPVSRAPLKDCLERGLLHRAVAVVVVRSDGALLMQRRSTKDRWRPGMWTLSSTGHVKSGETYERAARRELAEELGISTSVKRLGKFLLPREESAGLTEWEHVTLFVARSDAPPRADPEELEEVRAFSVPEVRKMTGGRELTPDARLLLKEFFRLSEDHAGPRRPVE